MENNSIWHKEDVLPVKDFDVLVYPKNGMPIIKNIEFTSDNEVVKDCDRWAYVENLPLYILEIEQESKELKDETTGLFKTHKKSELEWEKKYNELQLQLQTLKDFLANEVKPVVDFLSEEKSYQLPVMLTNEDFAWEYARELQEKIEEVLR